MIENIRLSFQGIWSHKMRSFLTMLGIIIGIASIISIVSTIKGTSEQIKEDLIGAGNNTVNITLYDGDYEYYPDSESGKMPPVISDLQKEQIREEKNILNATFFYSRSYAGVYYGETSFSGGAVLGIDGDYFDTCGYNIITGRNFMPGDFEGYAKVAIVDTNVVGNLFLGENPVGEILEIEQEPFVIIGVAGKKEEYLPKMEDLADYDMYVEDAVGTIMIPDTSWPIPFKFDEPQNVVIKADSTDSMSAAGKNAADILNSVIDNKKMDTSFAYKADDIMEQVRNMQKLSESTSQQLIWIASISLLVGGIGVMNIMLVSVTERTREIGLKKAIGARKNIILAQFLTEASVLTSIGGKIGVASGVGLSQAVSRISGAPSAISIPAIALSVLFSMAIGIIFGLLPSVKAANLNPIDALRSE